MLKYTRRQRDKLIASLIPIKIKPKLIGSFEGNLNARFLVATTRGLFLLEKDKIFQLLTVNCYGITFIDNQVLLYQNFGFKGRIISLPFTKELKFHSKGKVLVDNLPEGCHQIDTWNDKLYITDTYNNKILEYDFENMKAKAYLPLGFLKHGRQSENYGHMNSIYHSEVTKKTYVFCHNETKKTGKKSSVLVLDSAFESIEMLQTTARNGHNICLFNDNLFYCNSEARSLMKNKTDMYCAEYYTRGLSITDKNILIGGSEFKSRKERGKSKGMVDVLDHDFNTCFSISIPGPVQEIRCFDNIDYALSQHKID
jgi:hypothetical protein